MVCFVHSFAEQSHITDSKAQQPLAMQRGCPRASPTEPNSMRGGRSLVAADAIVHGLVAHVHRQSVCSWRTVRLHLHRMCSVKG